MLDFARRLQRRTNSAVASRGADLLLPVSMAHVWAVEIVAGGKLTRFERDAAERGSGILVNTATRPAALFTSPIPSRRQSSMQPSRPSMRRRRKRASGLPTRRVSPDMASHSRR